jgi:hypothetical protein
MVEGNCIRRALVVAVPSFLSACVFSPQFSDGQVPCGDRGACPPGLTCSNANNRCYHSLSKSCTPAACPQGLCGTMSDGCGNTITCTDCPTPDLALPDSKGCTPTTCMPNINCGTFDNGCNHVISCPACLVAHTCSADKPNSCECTKRTCADWKANCGTPPDLCNGIVPSCGTCAAGSCGGGGTPYVCGPGTCVSKTKCPPDACGKIPDGCGGILPCGDSNCKNGTICGGGGKVNVCG